jgi:hypothetical protein
MASTSTRSASDLARQTPASRDRYVDFLRLGSIAVVVLGHWLMAVIVWRGSEFRTGNVIAMVPGLWAATWLLQVMPIFFFVGGFANLATIDALRRKGHGASEFIASRIARLMRPVALLIAVWVPFAMVLEHLGFDERVLRAATKLVCQPLWFIGVYLAVTALAPCMRDLHARYGARVLIALATAIASVDVIRFGLGVDGIGYLNVLGVWLLAQQLGFFYADGRLVRIPRAALAATVVGALGALVALTTFGPYPLSMVGLPGDRISNMSPPTVCLAVLTVLQVALLMLARPAVSRWLQRERVWTATVAGNGVIMTIFLWHLSAALIAIAALHFVGFPQPDGGSAMWWLTRPIWLVAAMLPLLALLAMFARFERPRAAQYTAAGRGAPVYAGVGTALLSFAVFGVACSNIHDLLGNARVDVAVLAITPVQLLLCALLGIALVNRAARRAVRA